MDNWTKCASVRAGGKPYFYVRFNENQKTTVMWDRQSETWSISDKENLIETGYRTANKAMGSC